MKTLSKLNYFQLLSLSLVLVFSSFLTPSVAKADVGDEDYSDIVSIISKQLEISQKSPLITRWVKLTDNLNVRTGAGITYSVIQVVPVDSKAMIVGNPVFAGGITWYKVKFPSGPQGWIASNYTTLLPSLVAPAGAQVVSSFGGISVASVQRIEIEVDLPNKKSVVTLNLNNNSKYSKSFTATTTNQILVLVAGDMGVSVASLSFVPQMVSVIPDVVDGIHVFAKKGGQSMFGTQMWGWSVVVSYISENTEVYSSGTLFEVEIVDHEFDGDWEEYYKWLDKHIKAWKNNLVADYFGTGNPIPAKDALIALVAKTLEITTKDAEDMMTYDIDRNTKNGQDFDHNIMGDN